MASSRSLICVSYLSLSDFSASCFSSSARSRLLFNSSFHAFIYPPFNPFLQSSIYPDHSLCSSPPPSVHMLINSLSIYPSILFIYSIHPIHQSAIYPSNRSFVLSVPKSLYLADFSFVYSSIHPSLNPLILSVNHQLVRLFLPLINLLSIHLSMCPYSCLVRQSFI